MISQALKSAEQITLGNIEILEKILKLRHSCYFASILLPPTSTWPTAVIKVSDSLLIANSFKLGASHPFKLHVILRRVYQAINSIYICICISLNIYMLYLNLLNQIAFLLISAWNVQKLDRKFFFCLFFAACGVLIPWPMIELVPPTLETWSLDHWTAWEVSGSFNESKRRKRWFLIVQTWRRTTLVPLHSLWAL